MTTLPKIVHLLILLLSILIITPTLSSPHTIQNLNLKAQRFIMRLVRDLGRHKSRKRRYIESEKHGLVSVLFYKDDATLLKILNESLSEEMDIISPEELASATGEKEDDDPRLWIAVMGYVFDVSAGKKFYGQGGSYGMLSGRDATFALARGDLTLVGDKTAGLELDRESDLAEARRWLEYFVGHDKYVKVGRLPNKMDHVVDLDALVEQEMEHAAAENDIEELDDVGVKNAGNESKKEENRPPEWHPPVPVQADTKDCPGAGR